MLEVINDQTLESNLEGKMKDAIMEQVIFGTGAMKAGTLRIEKNHKWINSENIVIYEEEPMQRWRRFLFSIYTPIHMQLQSKICVLSLKTSFQGPI